MKNSQKLLEKIEKENITPISSWYFIIKNIGLWVIAILFILLGAISFAIMIDIFIDTDVEVLRSVTHSRIEFYMSFISFFWIFFLCIFLFFGYFGVSNTKKAYRYSFFSWMGGGVALSVVLGIIIFSSGYAKDIEHSIAQHISFYHGTEEVKKQHWTHAQEGFLSGEIIEIVGENTFVLQGWNGEKWNILYSQKSLLKQENNNSNNNNSNNYKGYNYGNKKYKSAKIVKGEKVRIRGNIKNETDKTFVAKRLMGW